MVFKYAGLVKNRRKPFFVIPVKTGIQCFKLVIHNLDSRLRGNDDFLGGYQIVARRKRWPIFYLS
jgi:hypothetical protein